MKTFGVFFLFLFVSQCGFSQETHAGELIKELKRTSVSIELLDSTSANIFTPKGSGFYLRKNNDFYAVTNFHVVPNFKRQKYFIGMNFDKMKVYTEVGSIITDSINDVAILIPGKMEIVVQNVNQSKIDTSILIQPRYLTPSVFYPNDSIKEGNEVLIIGYPLSIGTDLMANKPVSRKGMIAQEPNRKTNTFLIDGVVSHGNSGSPVYSSYNGAFLGMISSFPNDVIEAYDATGKFISVFDKYGKPIPLFYNSSISVCITAETIFKLIP